MFQIIAFNGIFIYFFFLRNQQKKWPGKQVQNKFITLVKFTCKDWELPMERPHFSSYMINS